MEHEASGPRPDVCTWPNRCARLVRRHPVVVLALVTAVLVLPTLGTRDFWAHDEVRHASALRHLLEDGHWLSLHMNGEPYPDKPPLWFWLVAAFSWMTGADGPAPFFLASGLGGFLFLLATSALARRTLGTGTAAALAPWLVLTTPLFQLLLRTTRMDLLFGALILASQVLLFRGYGRNRANRLVAGGFALAGLAALVKGPVGVLLPLVAALTWLAWRGRTARFLARDTAFGFGVVVLLVGAWGAGLWAVEGGAYVRRLVDEQVVGRALDARGHREPVWFYALTLPLSALPWAFLPLCIAPAAWGLGGAWRARRQGAGGRSFLVCAAASGFALLSLGSSKLFIYTLPLFGPLAVLASDLLTRASRAGARRLAWVAGGTGMLLAAAVPLVEPHVPWGLELRGLWPTAALLAAASLATIVVRHARATRVAAVLAAGLVPVLLCIAVWVVPSVDPVMSPRAQARVLVRHATAGHELLVFGVYGGTYSFYAGRALRETRDLATLRQRVASGRPLAVALSERAWRRRQGEMPGFVVVHRQMLEASAILVVARPAVPGAEGGG